jgi:1,4-dihydroxy-6-naphthoate synthase
MTLGISPCPNDVYIFAGMLLGHVPHEFTFVFEDVQTLNERAGENQFEALKISYAAYPGIAESYELLSCGGALGRGCGPLLLANGRAEIDPKMPVLVPGAQTTANFLLDFWAEDIEVQKSYALFDEVYEKLLLEPGTQGVVIHEKRFTYERDGLNCLVDLGEHWEAKTGFPIPLGAIVAKPGLKESLSQQIRASLAWSDAHPDEALVLCRNHATDLDDAVMRAHIGLYVNDFSHALGPDGEAAVAFFLRRANRTFDKHGNTR